MADDPKRVLNGSRKVWIGLLLLLPILALAERGLRVAYAGMWSPTGEAKWIWLAPAGEEVDHDEGVAFFVYRDFELSGYPGRARISCRADEEYLLYVNDTLVGAGRYRDGEPLATYEVGYLLEPGVNRLVAELRSGRGVGGLLLDLNIEGPEPLRIGSDESWSVVRGYRDDLIGPPEPGLGSASDGGESTERARVWSTPPVGRWGLPRLGRTAAVFADLVDIPHALHAPRGMSERTGDGWRGLGPPTVSSPPLGRTVTFDWGREVVGYANVVFGRKEGAKALVFAGTEPPDPAVDQPVAYLLNPVGRKSWSDTQPRRFRYLTVLATAEMVGARVLPLRAEVARAVLAGVEPPEGVFGIEPLRLRPPVEDEIRGELERLASVAAGQGV